MSGPIILGTNSIKDTGYDVDNSLRFNSGSSDNLSLSLSSTATNTKKGTLSFWFKTLGTNQQYPIARNLGTIFYLYFNSSGQLVWQNGTTNTRITNQVFRDPNAWGNLVVNFDTTQATASNRQKMFYNGVEITSFGTSNDFSQDQVISIFDGDSVARHISGYTGGGYYDGYICEVVGIDGEQLDPTSFGEFDSDSPTIWKPKDVSGLTFGNNGFYLEFKQSGTSANSSGLGADTSGNDHHFTVGNLTAVDQSLDTCTNNFAVLNALVPNAATYSEGNLKITTSSNWESSGQSIPVTQGKWYGEFIASSNSALIGVEDFDLVNTWSVLYFGSSANGVGYWNAYSGQLYKNNSYSSYAGGAYGSTDIVGIYLDMDNKYVYFSINGAMQNSGDPSSGSSGTGGEALSGTTYVMGGGNYTGNLQANFGSPPFAITSGNADANGYGNFEYNPTYSGVNYYSLNTKNLAEFG